MDIKGKKLKMVEQALQYAMMFAKTESETAEFAILLHEVVNAMNIERIYEAAPKMYNMLNKVLNVADYHQFNGHKIQEQVNDLLNEISPK